MTRASKVYWLRFAGLGDATSLRQWRYCTRALPGDPDGVYLPYLHSLPRSFGSTLNFFKQGEDRFEVGGQRVDLLANSTTRGHFLRTRDPEVHAYLASPLAAGSTTVVLNLSTTGFAGPLQNRAVRLGKEVLVLGTYSGTGPFTFTGCTRGAFDTPDLAHGVGTLDDTSFFLAEENPWRLYQKVVFGWVDYSGSYANEQVLGNYVLSAADQRTSLTRVSLTLDSYLEALKKKVLGSYQWKGRVNNRPGRQVRTQWVGVGLPESGNFVGSGSLEALFNLEGKSVFKGVWGTSWVDDANETSVSLSEHDLESWPQGLPTVPDDELRQVKVVDEVFSTHPDSPKLNSSGDQLSSNAVDWVRQTLQSSQRTTLGSRGPNGTYDLGLATLGLDFSDDQLDTNSFGELKERLGPLAKLEGLWLGLDDDSALEKVQTVLSLYFAWLAPGEGGKLGVYYLSDFRDGTEVSLGESDLVDEPQHDPQLNTAVGTVEAEFDFRPGYGSRKTPVQDYFTNLRYQFGSAQTVKLNFLGVASRDPDGYEAQQLVGVLGRAWLRRFRTPLPKYKVVVKALGSNLDATQVYPGQRVSFTHSKVPNPLDPTTLGVEDQLCVVVGKDFDPRSAEVELDLLNVEAGYTRQALVSPSAEVASVASLVVTVKANAFSSSLLPNQTNDTYRFRVGQVVEVFTRDGTTSRGTATLTAVTPGTPSLTFDAVPAGTTAGDLVELASYDSQTSGEKDENLFQADALNGLGAAKDAAQQWTL